MTDGEKGQKCIHMRKHSEETRRKMSESAKGKIFSESHIEKLKNAKFQNLVRFWKGKTFSEEHKKKLSDSAKLRSKNKKTENYDR